MNIYECSIISIFVRAKTRPPTHNLRRMPGSDEHGFEGSTAALTSVSRLVSAILLVSGLPPLK
jgi:hypothetical protein